MEKETQITLLSKIKTIKWDDVENLGLDKKDNLNLRNLILNQQPPNQWVKKHPIYGNAYLPIDKVEYLLTSIFKKWYVFVKSVFQIANSVVCIITLFYYDHEMEEFMQQDGTGAHELQVSKGANPMDSSKIRNNAVMLAVPIAETRAITDAADKIGRLFGRDLNRKDLLGYDNLVKNDKMSKIFEDEK